MKTFVVIKNCTLLMFSACRSAAATSLRQVNNAVALTEEEDRHHCRQPHQDHGGILCENVMSRTEKS